MGQHNNRVTAVVLVILGLAVAIAGVVLLAREQKTSDAAAGTAASTGGATAPAVAAAGTSAGAQAPGLNDGPLPVHDAVTSGLVDDSSSNALLGGSSAVASTSSSSSSVDTSASGALASAALAAHNAVRVQCSPDIPALAWDDDLAAYAQAYAEELAAAATLDHSLNGHDSYGDVSAGENLYHTSQAFDTGDGDAVALAANSWAAEGYGAGAAGSTTGHYTAMVWSETTTLGCGVAYGSGYGTVVSCNYAAHYPNHGSDYDSYVLCTEPIAVETTSGSSSLSSSSTASSSSSSSSSNALLGGSSAASSAASADDCSAISDYTWCAMTQKCLSNSEYYSGCLI